MSKSVTMYEDVKEVLDQALAVGGGTFTLATRAEAVKWRQRAYEFRKLYRETVRTSPYDRLIFPRLLPNSTEVVIKVMEQRGVFTPAPNGRPVVPAPTKQEDELLKEAEELAKNLGLDGDIL